MAICIASLLLSAAAFAVSSPTFGLQAIEGTGLGSGDFWGTIGYDGTAQADLERGPTSWSAEAYWEGTLSVGGKAYVMDGFELAGSESGQFEDFTSGKGTIGYLWLIGSGTDLSGNEVVFGANLLEGAYSRSTQLMTIEVEGPAKICDASVSQWDCASSPDYLASSGISIRFDGEIPQLGTSEDCTQWSSPSCVFAGTFTQTDGSPVPRGRAAVARRAR